MIDSSNVSAVLVTRGDQDLQPIYDSIEQAGITDIVEWNNAEKPIDLKCYGRYAAIRDVENEYVYFQDDDLIVPVERLLKVWDFDRDSASILTNNRMDEEWPLLGIGSLFPGWMPEEAFDEYLSVFSFDEEFLRTCDVVFAYSWPVRRVVLGYENLPWHSTPGASMYLEPDHMAVRLNARFRTFALQGEFVA